MHHRILRSAEFLVRGNLPPALPQETLRQARSKFFEAWGVGSSLEQSEKSKWYHCLEDTFVCIIVQRRACMCILAHAWSKNGLVQRGCWDRHRNCWEQVLQGVADVQADWPQEAVLVPEHRSATFASLRFMLCWKVRLLWRVLHSRSTAREAACWSRVFGSGFEFRLNAEFENCYELIFLMARSAWDWCWIFHMVDEFGIPRSANFGLQHLTCCRTSCPNWCSVQSWNPREWWFLPERAVPQGKYEVKWSIWWTSLGKKYQNTPTIRSWDLLSACFLNAGHVVSGLPLQGCEYKHPHNFIVHCGILVWQELQVPCYTIVLETGGWGRLGLGLAMANQTKAANRVVSSIRNHLSKNVYKAPIHEIFIAGEGLSVYTNCIQLLAFLDHFIVFQLRNRRGIRNLEPQLAAMPLMQQLPGDRSCRCYDVDAWGKTNKKNVHVFWEKDGFTYTATSKLRCSILFVCAGPTRSGSCILRCSMRWCFCLTLCHLVQYFWDILSVAWKDDRISKCHHVQNTLVCQKPTNGSCICRLTPSRPWTSCAMLTNFDKSVWLVQASWRP